MENFTRKTRGNHVWLDIRPLKRKCWTPHLHLEFEPKSDSETRARGIVRTRTYTLDIFHVSPFYYRWSFSGAMTYWGYILNDSIKLDMTIMLLMIFSWFLLYFLAKAIRKKAYNQMKELGLDFNTIINPSNSNT